MNTTTYTRPIDLYRQGVAVLTDHLGPVDSVRFLRLLDQGSGDYTATRQSQPGDEWIIIHGLDDFQPQPYSRSVGVLGLAWHREATSPTFFLFLFPQHRPSKHRNTTFFSDHCSLGTSFPITQMSTLLSRYNCV